MYKTVLYEQNPKTTLVTGLGGGTFSGFSTYTEGFGFRDAFYDLACDKNDGSVSYFTSQVIVYFDRTNFDRTNPLNPHAILTTFYLGGNGNDNHSEECPSKYEFKDSTDRTTSASRLPLVNYPPPQSVYPNSLHFNYCESNNPTPGGVPNPICYDGVGVEMYLNKTIRVCLNLDGLATDSTKDWTPKECGGSL